MLDNITAEQVYNCLFNGNNKKTKSGKLPQGLFNVADIPTEKLPQGLPQGAKTVFISNNNVVCYTADKLYINAEALPHLTDIQKASLKYIKNNTQLEQATTELGWSGKSGAGVDKATQVANKLAGMLK